MDTIIKARQIANYLLSLPDFKYIDRDYKNTYNHMGALLTDVVLQAGLNYDKVVYPRIQQILISYPLCTTTDTFFYLLKNEGPYSVIKWRHYEKINRLYEVIRLLRKHSVQSEADLKRWILLDDSASLLLEIKGIGPKSVDYLKTLLNISNVAVDRHIKRFISQAGVEEHNYYDLKRAVEYSADLIGISRQTLDYSIWQYIRVSNSRKA